VSEINPVRTRAVLDALQIAFDRAVPKPESRPEGRRLSTIPRGRDVELRLTMETFEGRPFLSLRLWQRLEDGSALPTKKGLSIRLRELPELIGGLLQAAEITQEILEREGGSE
jgi:hypothetical protein